MKLEQLQTNIFSIIKSGNTHSDLFDVDYFDKVAAGKNLLLIRKIAIWWRKTQVENYCRLTSNLLKATDNFESHLSAFFGKRNYSSFREEVGQQFLEYIISEEKDPIISPVAAFELAIIQLSSGINIESKIIWYYEPYAIINALLKNTFTTACLQKGSYVTGVCYKRRNELFTVVDLNVPS